MRRWSGPTSKNAKQLGARRPAGSIWLNDECMRIPGWVCIAKILCYGEPHTVLQVVGNKSRWLCFLENCRTNAAYAWNFSRMQDFRWRLSCWTQILPRPPSSKTKRKKRILKKKLKKFKTLKILQKINLIKQKMHQDQQLSWLLSREIRIYNCYKKTQWSADIQWGAWDVCASAHGRTQFSTW